MLGLRLTPAYPHHVEAAKVCTGSVDLFKTVMIAQQLLLGHNPGSDRLRLNLIPARQLTRGTQIGDNNGSNINGNLDQIVLLE